MLINKRIEKLENFAKPNAPRITTVLIKYHGSSGVEEAELLDVQTGEVETTTDQKTIEEWSEK